MDLDPDACYRALLTRDARFDGRFFTGVKTTGVYCRPVCPARTPRRENCTFHPSAAAAEAAGFRACLRCRPETAPELGAWRGSSNTVARALRLIEAGALDGGDVEALGERLGVGGRQLRRLFRQHLGASPVAVAQTRRVLLAKQLVHETVLPMTEVALASGFGSVRRFNETFQALYARPPSALRRRSGSAAPGDAVSLKLRYRPPYDWAAMFAYLGERAVPGVERLEGRRYSRTLAVGEHAGVVSVEPIAGDQVRVEVRFPNLSALPHILARVRRVFDLGADPAAVGEHLSGDPALAPLIAARPGLRVPGAWDGFESAVRAVLGQQITVVQAVRLASSLAERYGEPVPAAFAAPGLIRAFPSPTQLAAADLSWLPMPRARSRALESLAQAVAADPNLFGPRASLEDAVKRLRALPGIGEWTAQYVALRELREPDAFPAADVALLKAAAAADGTRPTPAQLLARAEAWRPWRAYAAVHLWTSLGGGPTLAETPNDPGTDALAA
jgi:AraC family transcriptional regulator, regulatory protein of adaptative response / DNA-3-methyladenine glycosylase II